MEKKTGNQQDIVTTTSFFVLNFLLPFLRKEKKVCPVMELIGLASLFFLHA